MNAVRPRWLRACVSEFAVLATLVAAPVLLARIGFSVDLLTRC